MKGNLVVFRILRHTNKKTSDRFCRSLYGYTDKSNMGKYTYHRHGLLDEIPHVKLIRGVIITQVKDAPKLIDLLKKHGAEYHIREVRLNQSDEKALR